jgi:hypothetical protein
MKQYLIAPSMEYRISPLNFVIFVYHDIWKCLKLPTQK